MADEFLLADTSNPDPTSWNSVVELLSDSPDITLRALEWTHEDHSRYEKLASGKMKGLGFPIVTWIFKALRPIQRENFRLFCAGLSESVYIRTPTNNTLIGERIWVDYICLMNWSTRSELVGVEWVEMVELTFTHCVVVNSGS